MTGLLFITAPEADRKIVNLLLLHLADWTAGYEDGYRNAFKLVTTKNAYDLDRPHDTPQNMDLDCTSPPIASPLDNAWTGARLEDIEAFCRDLSPDGTNTAVNALNYVVLDSAGLQARNCILGHRAVATSADDDEFAFADTFDKMRVPWQEVYIVWCNLDIANMDFVEFTREFEEGGFHVELFLR